MKSIVLTHKAAKELDNPFEPAPKVISDALIAYAVEGKGDVKKLAERDGLRPRVGSYRVIFDDDGATVLAIYIGKRATATFGRN
jgi:mRNA interferase RelE/StbE